MGLEERIKRTILQYYQNNRKRGRAVVNQIVKQECGQFDIVHHNNDPQSPMAIRNSNSNSKWWVGFKVAAIQIVHQLELSRHPT